ncbi:methyl-accepting chemotaxis protein [Oceanospirillum sediminis]|uniref:Methyl-accepting chemotaxis protein n=1 Tax=Oceanospirillum sediminis TaxID=2760088 RepID=A0A839IV35_9GAMM|nr:methyl-accepting chemotaxis protein [Oceanospirillum sediminis]MBB1488530.1 methyl-accepting chemotaxis protein [Oceanospirillum sediminis]
MVNSFQNKSLAAQLTIVISILMILASTAMTLFLTREAKNNLETEAEAGLKQQSQLVSDLLGFYYQDSFNNAKRLSDIFFNMFPQGVSPSNKTVSVANYQTRALTDEKGIINGDFSKPDEFTRMTGGTATVFARHGDDFLRISTSLKKENGDRAFGTLLGTGHPGYKKLIAGQTYHGVAHLFGRDYMTIYRPVQKDGTTIAVLYIGFDLTQGLTELKQTLARMTVGETGYATVLAGKGHKQEGTVLMHPKIEGAKLQDVKAADGTLPFRIVLEQKDGLIHYSWQDKNNVAREKIAAFHHVEGWNWIVLLGSFSDEFAETSILLRNMMIILMAVSTLIIIAVCAVMLYRRLAPLNKVTQDLVTIGQGQLNINLPPVDVSRDCSNEILLLRQGTISMHQGLTDLVSQLSQASYSLKQNVSQVQQASSNTEEAVDQQSLETQQVVCAMEEMAATTADVADNARESANTTLQGQDKATSGQQASEAIHMTIDFLAAEMQKASDLIKEVSQESNNISEFIVTISEVAEQTNLLALNAAIEAARAGESGRGFAVVADEVRTLAGRTQNATSEISQLVERLQNKITQAVSAIETSNDASQESRERTIQARDSLTEISDYMAHISDMGNNIAAAAEQQAAVAETVTQSLHNIKRLSDHTRIQSDTSVAASEDLKHVADEIEQKLSRFRL